LHAKNWKPIVATESLDKALAVDNPKINLA